MELLNRYRNITVLSLVIFAQLVLLAYQVKGQGDVRLIRVWAVTAITPVANVVETVRSGAADFLDNYFSFRNLRQENDQIRRELAKYKLENQFLRTELETADRLKALASFQARSQSKMLPARVIATGTGANSRVVFLDRGSRAAVQRGMAVITPDGIVGKVIASFPTAAQVLLVTDPTFAAGVISQKHRVRGTLRGQGHGNCTIDYVQNEEKIEVGERFFTSGDDGVFPRGLAVGTVTAVKPGNPHQQVFLVPSGLQAGLEEVLIVLEGAHETIPEHQEPTKEVYIQPPPAAEAPAEGEPVPTTAPPLPSHLTTEADRLRERYKAIGEAQGHVFGEGLPGSRPPDFNLTPEEVAARAARARAAEAAKTATPAPPAGTGTQAQPRTAPPAQSQPQPGARAGQAPAQAKPPAPPAATAPKPAAPRAGPSDE